MLSEYEILHPGTKGTGQKSPEDKHVGHENAIMHLHALAFVCYAFRRQNVAVIATPPTKFQEYL